MLLPRYAGIRPLISGCGIVTPGRVMLELFGAGEDLTESVVVGVWSVE